MNHDRIMSYAMQKNAIIPTAGSQCHTLLEAMFNGEKLTVASALNKYGCYALSQRAGDLRSTGWPVKDEWVKLGAGKKIKKYWLEV